MRCMSSSMRKDVELAARLDWLGNRVIHQVLGVECEFLRIDLGGGAAIRRWRSVECERDKRENGEQGKQHDLFHRSPPTESKATIRTLARRRHPGCDG